MTGPVERSGRPVPTVVAVVVTYNRVEVLSRTLAALVAQSRPPDQVLVVDNASTDGTAEVLTRADSGVGLLRMPDNLGFGAGLAAGMRQAAAQGADYCWLLDDDSCPAPGALAAALAAAVRHPRAGILGYSGGLLRWGVPERTPFDVAGVVATAPDDVTVYVRDWALVDGALVPRRTMETVGYPRSDFFMMMEDVEYTARIRRSGAQVLVLQPDLITRAHLGSTGLARSAPPWREYYQTRNHLLTAMERRSARELVGWAFRQSKFLVAEAVRPRGLSKVRYRLVGAAHGLAGRTGRTLDPASGRFAGR